MASDLRSVGREFDPRPGRGCVTTLGKVFTPNCLDTDTLLWYIESLNWVPLPLPFTNILLFMLVHF